jgi:hypothetical protein
LVPERRREAPLRCLFILRAPKRGLWADEGARKVREEGFDRLTDPTLIFSAITTRRVVGLGLPQSVVNCPPIDH